MPVTGYAGPESTIYPSYYVVFEFILPWTWAEFDQGVKDALTLMRAQPQPIPLLIEGAVVASIKDVPPGPAAQKYSQALVQFAPVASIIVLVGGTSQGKSLLSALNASNPKLKGKIHLVETRKEALTMFLTAGTLSDT